VIRGGEGKGKRTVGLIRLEEGEKRKEERETKVILYLYTSLETPSGRGGRRKKRVVLTSGTSEKKLS